MTASQSQRPLPAGGIPSHPARRARLLPAPRGEVDPRRGPRSRHRGRADFRSRSRARSVVATRPRQRARFRRRPRPLCRPLALRLHAARAAALGHPHAERCRGGAALRRQGREQSGAGGGGHSHAPHADRLRRRIRASGPARRSAIPPCSSRSPAPGAGSWPASMDPIRRGRCWSRRKSLARSTTPSFMSRSTSRNRTGTSAPMSSAIACWRRHTAPRSTG